MKKAGIILKSGFIAIAVFVFSTNGIAQTVQPTGNDQSQIASPDSKSSQLKKTNYNTNQNVAKAQLNPNLAAQKRSAILNSNPGSTSRKCTTKSTDNPFAISRSVFNSLPKDRQQFVMDHLDKYSIVD